MQPFVEQQAPIDRKIANSLIYATPETWASATLSVSRACSGEHGKLTISITGPENSKELVGPTEEMTSALYELVELYRAHGNLVWSGLRYFVEQDKEGNWRYQANFEYPAHLTNEG